ncbi:MAG TPA: glycosyltransferase [Candidatus Paceibacterota bacterium]|nr:glycosyltransferase [Candidatus Paceibacterota bacterium]
MRVAVLLPCYNEGPVIASVVADAKQALPQATIYVYDNNSTDDTVEKARAAGAVVKRENHQGKGNVVRRMFADVEADVYILADGDGTYPMREAPMLIQELLQHDYDMVTGVRVADEGAAYRSGHRFGNRLITSFTSMLFASSIADMLSGYRVFSRRYVKSFPALSSGFEIETELTIHALSMRLRTGEVPVAYGARKNGTASKLRTYSDGMRIARTIALLLKEERPFQVLGTCAIVLAAAGVAFGIPVVLEFFATGFVLRLPTAVLATGLMLLSALCLFSGIILDGITRTRRELRWLNYLSYTLPPTE